MNYIFNLANPPSLDFLLSNYLQYYNKSVWQIICIYPWLIWGLHLNHFVFFSIHWLRKYMIWSCYECRTNFKWICILLLKQPTCIWETAAPGFERSVYPGHGQWLVCARLPACISTNRKYMGGGEGRVSGAFTACGLVYSEPCPSNTWLSWRP